MKLILLSIAALVALAASCIPPLLDATHWNNMTNLALYMAQFESNPATGWTHVVDDANTNHSPIKTWPRNRVPMRPGIVLIPYCFHDAFAKSRLAAWLNAGWDLWRSRIGNPSQENGHRLGGFYEFTTGGNTPFCRNADGSWNGAVPPDTLEVRSEGRVQSGHATLGYRYGIYNSQPGRHTLSMGTDITPGMPPDMFTVLLKKALAHEMGHVLGLYHEHQRGDHYIHFECEYLQGYAEAKAVVESQGQHTMDEVCDSSYLGRYYNFQAYSFSTEVEWDIELDPTGQHKFGKTVSAMYDLNSIMHYDSWQGSNLGLGEVELLRMHLLKWKERYSASNPPPEHPTVHNVEPIRPVYQPSYLDIEAVIQLYAW